jgi:hypothetical protein
VGSDTHDSNNSTTLIKMLMTARTVTKPCLCRDSRSIIRVIMQAPIMAPSVGIIFRFVLASRRTNSI